MSTDAAAQVADRAGVVGGATLASRVLGFARDAVLANVFAERLTDAFFVAFTIPNVLRRLVGEGALTTAFVPVFTDWLQRSAEDARRVFNATWTLGVLLGLVLTAAGIIWAPELIRAFAPGFAADPDKHALAATLLRLCFPYIACMIVLAVAMGALNVRGHFFSPAIAPVLLNLLLIAAALTGGLWLDVPILALGWGALAAGVLQVLLQVPALVRRGLKPQLVLAPRHPALRQLGRLMGPAVLGASVFQLNLLVNRFLASFGGDGAVSYLYYADRLLELPLGVFVLALGTAALPSFAQLVSRRDRPELQQAFSSTLSLALTLAAPSALGLMLLREPIFTALFRWDPDVFSEQAVSGCARALWFYALGLVPITVSRIFVNLCVAHQDTRTGAQAALVSLLVNVVCSLALIGPLPVGELPGTLVQLQHRMVIAELGYAGLALAASIASAANAVYVITWAQARHGSWLHTRDLLSWGRIGLACVVMGWVVAALAAAWPMGPVASPAALVQLGAYVLAGAAGYLGTLAVMRAPEATLLVRLLPRRAAR